MKRKQRCDVFHAWKAEAGNRANGKHNHSSKDNDRRNTSVITMIIRGIGIKTAITKRIRLKTQ